MTRFALSCLLLGLATGLVARGQNFSTVSNRNHPEIQWRTATTDHFTIVHPAHLDQIAAEAAPIAEATYDSLSAGLDVSFQEKIRVYLSDQDAIVNGFALPFGTGYTDIWVNVNDAATQFSSPSEWIRVVLAHELVHIFYFQATESELGIWGRLFGPSPPGYWTEGVAQYQSETWNAQRGERWLRAAVLDDELSHSDGQSLWNGRLLYAKGHSQVRYFAQQYGDSTLTDLLHHKTDVFFGAAEVYNFETAFKDVTGTSYETFSEQWRRDVNVYYNTLAGQLESLDSLRTDTFDVPGQFVLDVAYSPDTARVAVLSELSPERPVRRLRIIDRSTGAMTTVANGPIEPTVAWSPDGTHLAFSRQTRAAHGSIVDDLFVVRADGGNERRLTYGRRTSAPTFGPDGERLAFVATDDGTANVHFRNRATGDLTQVTSYDGSVQLTGLQWHPTRDTLALARDGAEGDRELVLYDLDMDTSTVLTAPSTPDRRPVWSPDGESLAYTSLRDGVPNAFVYSLEAGGHRRVTHLARGATVHDWVPADSAFHSNTETSPPGEALVTSTTLSKSHDAVFRIPATRTAPRKTPSIPAPYAEWTSTQPPTPIPRGLSPDSSLIDARGDYDPLRNLTDMATLALPYYSSTGDYGIQGFTSWTEPLGKHSMSVAGRLSLSEPGTQSEIVATYRNRQLYPTIGLTLFSASSSARIYGSDLLVEDRTGGELSLQWPLDWRVGPYVSTSISARVRYADLEPLDRDSFVPALGELAPPQDGQQATLRLQFLRRKKPPYRHTLVHPLHGWGVRVRAMGAASILGGDSSYLRGDVAGYQIFPSIGKQRLFAYGRFQAQTGSAFPQDYVGLSRYDPIEVPLPSGLPVTLGDAERVRGHRSYALGNRMAFGRLEYRIPFASSLRTTVLGVVEFGHTTLSAFQDGGMVWNEGNVRGGIHQLGTGLELKNAVRLFGVRIGHALGVAQPTSQVGTTDGLQLYYRVQTALPF